MLTDLPQIRQDFSWHLRPSSTSYDIACRSLEKRPGKKKIKTSRSVLHHAAAVESLPCLEEEHLFLAEKYHAQGKTAAQKARLRERRPLKGHAAHMLHFVHSHKYTVVQRE